MGLLVNDIFLSHRDSFTSFLLMFAQSCSEENETIYLNKKRIRVFGLIFNQKTPYLHINVHSRCMVSDKNQFTLF